MKMNKWTMGLAALGVVSLASAVQAEEKMNVVQTALSATTLKGYVDTSAQLTQAAGQGYNAPAYAFNRALGSSQAQGANGFNLDVIGLTLEKPITEGEWAAGYKVDLWAGPYANNLNTSSAFPTANDFCIKQAYVALKVPVGNGINLKMGVFDSPLGYESSASVANPNFTRSYGYTIEPTTFTGLLGTYQICEVVAVSAGVANTYGPAINERNDNNPGYLAYMGSIAVTAPESMGFLAGSALYAGIVQGYNTQSPANAGTMDSMAAAGGFDQTSCYMGATMNTPIKELKVGIAYDYASVSVQPLSSQNEGYANAIAGYLSFQATEKLSLHGRAEYASHGGPDVPGAPTRIMGLTGTIQYDLWANVLTRLEARFDRNLNGANAYGGSAAYSIQDGFGGWIDYAANPTRQNNAMLALNVIYKF